MSLNLNSSPYFDDFDSEKNYNRILFKPGVAVQARELTQTQTILQNQIASLGSFTLKAGAIISGCAETQTQIDFVKILDSDFSSVAISNSSLVSYIGDTVVGNTTGITATIIDVKTGTEGGGAVRKTLYLSYTSLGGDTNVDELKHFGPSEKLTVQSKVSARNGDTFVVSSTDAGVFSTAYFGKAPRMQLSEGIIYAKGQFIRTSVLSTYIDDYSPSSSKNIGFLVTESVVSSSADTTLLDPASGSYNFNAPGADRYKAVASLVSYDKSVAIPEDFFLYSSWENGSTVRASIITDPLAGIGDIWAKRAYDANGDYVVAGMKIDVREHLLDGENKGVHRLVAGGDAEKLIFYVEKGSAVTGGYTRELFGRHPIIVEKPTDYVTKESIPTSTSYGNYIVVNESVGVWDIDGGQIVSLWNLPILAITSGDFSALPRRTIPTSGITTGTDTIGYTAHGLLAGTEVKYYNGGSTSATGLTSESTYFVIASGLTANAFKVSATAGGSTVDISGTGNNAQYFEIQQATVGTAKVRHVVRESGTPGTAVAEFRIYLYDIKMSTGNFSDVRSIISTDSLASGMADLVLVGGSAVIQEANYNKLIWRLPYSSIKTLKAQASAYDYNFIYSKEYDTEITQATAAVTITVSGNETFPYSVGALSDTIILNNIIVVAKDEFVVDSSTTYESGKHINLSGKVTLNSATSLTVDLGTAVTTATVGRRVKIYVNVQVADSDSIAKSLVENRYVKIFTDDHANRNTGTYSLGVSDVHRIVQITASTNANYTTSAEDVTDQFKFDTGQTDNSYGHSKIILKSTSTLDVSVKKYILVKFDYFTRSVSGPSFACKDSYPINDGGGSGTITTPEIPVYISAKNGSFDLRNCVDFRPYTISTSVPAASVGAATINPSQVEQIERPSDGLTNPVPVEQFNTDLQYYLSMGARVVLDYEGKFQVLTSPQSEIPTIPRAPDRTMTLATVVLPPYPSLAPQAAKLYDRSDLGITLLPIENKRYTMRDVSALEKRISNLEYYTSLNILEKEARDTKILDSSGVDRFKNGLLVDPFTGHNIADVGNPDNHCSIDLKKQELRAFFNQEVVEFKPVSSGTTAGQTGDLFHVPYYNAVYQEQLFASKSRVVVGELLPGVVTRTPDTTTPVPPVIVVGANSSPTYRLLRSSTVVNEGESLTITLETTGLVSQAGIASGATYTVPYTITGIVVGDINEASLTGNFTLSVAGTGTATFLITRSSAAVADTLILTLNGIAASTSVTLIGTATTTPPQHRSTYNGALKLSPASDEWYDTTYVTPTYSNGGGAYDNFSIDPNAWSTVWGAWEEVSYQVQSGADTQVNSTQNGYAIHTADVLVTSSRAGVSTYTGYVPGDVTTIIGEKVINTTYSTYTRPVSVSFEVDALMPNSSHYLRVEGRIKASFVTDSQGRSAGSFSINQGEFQTGNLSISIVNDGAGSVLDGTSYAQVVFPTGGKQVEIQQEFTTTTWPTIGTRIVHESSNSTVSGGITWTNFNLPGHVPTVIDQKFVTDTNKDLVVVSALSTTDRYEVDTTPAPLTTSVSTTIPTVYTGDIVFISPDEDVATLFTVSNTEFVGPLQTNTVAVVATPQQALVPENIGYSTEFVAEEVVDWWSVYNYSNWMAYSGWDGYYCPNGMDPLAQTFYVSGTPGGIYVTQVDLYFKHISSEANNNGITLELREVVNGVPGPRVIPNGSSRKRRSDCNISTTNIDDTVNFVATTFSFRNPVYLENDKEYCIVPIPDANDEGYECWVAELGELKIGTNVRISKQAHTGVLYTSANNRSWTPHQSEDLMFSIKRANFETNTDYTVRCKNKNHDWIEFSGFSTGTSFEVGTYVNGFTPVISSGGVGYGSVPTVVFTGGSGVGLAATATLTGGVITAITITNPGSGYLSAPTVTFTGGAPSSAATVTVVLNLGKVMLWNSIYNTATIEVLSGHFADNMIIGNETSYATVDTIHDRVVNAFVLKANTMQPNSAGSIVSKIALTTSGAGSVNTTTENVVSNQTIEILTEKRIYSYSNEYTLYSGNKSATIDFVVSTDSHTCGPMVDLASLMLPIFTNDINYPEPVTEDVREGGDASSKYISRKVVLATGQDAEDLKVYLDNKIPPGTDVKVFAKLINDADDASFKEDIYWLELDLSESPAESTNEYGEYVYVLPEKGGNTSGTAAGVYEYDVTRVSAITITNAGSGYSTTPNVLITHSGDGYGAAAVVTLSGGVVSKIQITDPGRGYDGGSITISITGGGGSSATATASVETVTYSSFKAFAIKIVHLSDNTSIVPKTSGLRAYALQV